MWAGARGHHAEPKFPDILTDDELRAIAVPVLVSRTVARDGLAYVAMFQKASRVQKYTVASASCG